MPKNNIYRVYASSLTQYCVDVEANSEAEALKLAEEHDGGEFKTLDLGDWNIESDTIEKLA